MIYYILKIDYSLSYWFSKSKDKIVPGTSFLFLNKLVFYLVFLLIIIFKLHLTEIDIKIFVGILMIFILIVMYYLQKPVEKFIKKCQLEKDYLKIDEGEIQKRRIIGVVLFIFSFLLMFVPVFF